MKQKFALLFAGVAAAAVLLAGCSSSSSSTSGSAVQASGVSASTSMSTSTPGSMATITPGTSATSGNLPVFTVDELAQYNGKDGNRAYVAVEGVVYDVTDVPQWAGGEHNGYSAGQDLTDAIENVSPHGVGVLDGVPVVGTLQS